MTDSALATGGLVRLMSWLSPAYPVGGFSYSHALEMAVEEGRVPDRAALVGWIGHLLHHGAGRQDGAALAEAWRDAGDADAIDALCDIAAARKGTAELAREALQQGSAFVTTTAHAWPTANVSALAARRRGRPIPLPVAVGVAAADAGIPLDAALVAYLHGFVSALVAAAVKLVPLGQSDGQAALAALAGDIVAAATVARDVPFAESGTASPIVDILSMRHETQYTRLFRS